MTEREETPIEREQRLLAEGRCACGAILPHPGATMCLTCLVGMLETST